MERIDYGKQTHDGPFARLKIGFMKRIMLYPIKPGCFRQREDGILINSIGISKSLPVLGSDFSAWDYSLQVMLYGAVKVCRVLVPLIEDGGRIIHITSTHHE